MRAFFSHYRYTLILLFAGLLWLEFLNFVLQLELQTFIYPDADSYLESSRNLFVFHRGHPYRPLLMAFINGIPYWFGSRDAFIFQWSIWVNIACWLASGCLVFSVLKKDITDKAAFVFALLFYLFIGSAVITFHLLAESIFMFFLVFFLFLLKKYETSHEFRWLAFALSILVASMLVKPASKFLAIIITIYFIRVLWQHYKSRFMIPFYGALMLVLVQAAGIKHEFGSFTISYIDVVTLHNYLLSKSRCIEAGKEYAQENNPRAEYLFSLPVEGQKKAAEADLKLQVRENFPNIVKAVVSDIAQNTSHGTYAVKDCKNEKGTSYFSFFQKALFEISKYQNRIMTIAGFLLSLYFLWYFRENEVTVSVTSFIVVYVVVLSGVSCGQGDRFHIILFPMMLMLAALFLLKKKWLKPSSAPLQKASRSHI